MPDNYARYYADKLWNLLPAVYRAEDTDDFDKRGPLREMVERIGAQVAVVRRQIDRSWEDQSIESCDDWAIPYIADLLATNLVSSLDARGQRLDVAKTIYYRRRKGTVALLEELANDITGWDARVVEFFRRMGRTRHGLDPEIGIPAESEDPQGAALLQAAEGLVGASTRTHIGGWADLRNVHGATLSQTAFDEFYHAADLRRGRGMLGWHNIPRLGVFLWRLYSFPRDASEDPDRLLTTPVAQAAAGPCANRYTFDPTGREAPLFAAPSRGAGSYGDSWVSPREEQLPTPVGSPLLEKDRAKPVPELYTYAPDINTLVLNSFGVFRNSTNTLVPYPAVKLNPEKGRFTINSPHAGDHQSLRAWYHYGFSSTIGAGSYERRAPGETLAPRPTPEAAVVGGGGALTAPLGSLAPTGTVSVRDSLTYDAVADVGTPANPVANVTVRAGNKLRPLIRLAAGTEWAFQGAAGGELFLEGLFLSGGDIVLRGDFERVVISCCTLDPGGAGAGTGPGDVFAKTIDGRDLVPSRVWVEGGVRLLEVRRSITGPVRARAGGFVERLKVSDSIVQGIRSAPFGDFVAADLKDAGRLVARLRDARDPVSQFVKSGFSAELRRRINGYRGVRPTASLRDLLVSELNALIARPAPSIYDANRFRGVRLSPETTALIARNPSGADLVRLNRLLLEEAYPAELADLALALSEGEADLARTTLLGPAYLHQIHASECILDESVLVENTQRGCVRFSAWATGSVLPRRYESVEVAPRAPLFVSRVFGQPGYAQLIAGVDAAVVSGGASPTLAEGAENGSEMGAFARENNPIKQRSLLIKYEEFMPLGLVPVVVNVT